ncbi:MAG: hypothetical protein ACFE0Q_08030 [Anaerolineae bacterium]
MPDRTDEHKTQAGEPERVESEPRLEREPDQPAKVLGIEFPKEFGSTTGIMRIRREANDETTQGDEDNPL